VGAEVEANGGQGAERYALKAISRALDVLDAFPDGETSLSLMQLRHLKGFPEASLFRILLTLESKGYLVRNPDGSFHAAPKVILGRAYEVAEHMRQLTHPYLRTLNGRFDETASMAYLFGERIQVVDTIQSFHEIRITNIVGRVLPPHCSSMGKAILAFQSPEATDRIVQAYGLHRRTERSIVDRALLSEELARIRSRGYSIDDQENVLGGRCFGAPIFVEKTRAAAALSVSVPLVRLTSERESQIVEAMLAAAREASATVKAATV
jgi:DNA-binding IclR family transcriptional regulator